MSNRDEFVKARIRYERALAVHANVVRVTTRELNKAEQEVELRLRLLSNLAVQAGFCEWCFKPLNEGTHDGPDHIAYAGVEVGVA